LLFSLTAVLILQLSVGHLQLNDMENRAQPVRDVEYFVVGIAIVVVNDNVPIVCVVFI
jgi:hypothetical protein